MLKSSHESVEFVCSDIINNAEEGILVTRSDGKKLRSHLMLSSYLADLPEAEYMTSVKRNSLTASPFHRCNVFKADLPSCTKYTEGNLRTTTELIEKLKEEDTEIVKTLKMKSILSFSCFG